MTLGRPFKACIADRKSSRRVATIEKPSYEAPMANTYSSLHYHLIFSTKNRVNWIKPDVESRIWSYIGGIARTHRMSALQIGGCDDHVHALIQAPPIYSPSEIVQYLKGQSSKWIHEEFPTMGNFSWQDGYGGFTVSKSNLPDVIRY